MHASFFFSGSGCYDVLLLVIIVCVVGIDGECNPTTYLFGGGGNFSNTDPPANTYEGYCTNLEMGGARYCVGHDQSKLSGWNWIGGTCYKNANYKCPCNAKDCSANCYCVSSFNDMWEFCYNGLEKKCPFCNPTADEGLQQYNLGCGCLNCGYLKSIGREAVYGLTTCDNFDNNVALQCGPGVCQVCPPGYMCPDKLSAIPCPVGFYQNLPGQAVCRECVLDTVGFYIPYPLKLTSACDPKQGLISSTKRACDECTDITGSVLHFCPEYNRGYGIFSTAKDGKTCRPCIQCSGKEYARPTSSENYCVTDTTRTQCAQWYNNQTDTAYGYNGETYIGLNNEKAVQGEMPWRAGYKRTLSQRRYVPGDSEKGLLPYYTPCTQTSYKATGYRPRLSMQQALTARDWSKDCDLLTTRECANGYYAVLAPYTEDDGFDILEECKPCPLNSTGGGALNTECNCNAGFASLTQLMNFWSTRGVQALVPDAGDKAMICINCIDDVYWRSSAWASEVRQEAIACPGDGRIPIGCTGSLEYVKASNPTVCSSCESSATVVACTAAQTSIPLQNRKGCHMCPAGTSVQVVENPSIYGCLPCAEGYFQDKAGQCSCQLKRTRCEPGFHVVQNMQVAMDLTRDYDCEPCPLACPEGQITIRAPNHTTTSSNIKNNNTCNGAGGSFFACYDGTDDGSAPTLTPGYRLSFPLHPGNDDGSVATGTRAVMEHCDASLMPSHASWVTFPVPTMGVECYFACMHGLNGGAATDYNKKLLAYLYSNREDLLPFVPSLQSSLVAQTQQLQVQRQNTHVTRDAVWQYSADATVDKPSLDDGTWTIKTKWFIVSADPASEALRKNTFLFQEDVLKANRTIAESICMSPAQAYTGPCPPGFAAAPAMISNTKATCALTARKSFLQVISTGSQQQQQQQQQQQMFVVADASGKMVVCEAIDTSLTQFSVDCGAACLNTRLQRAKNALGAEIPQNLIAEGSGSPWYNRLAWIAYLLQAFVWIRAYDNFNPYLPCTTTSGSSSSFLSLADNNNNSYSSNNTFLIQALSSSSSNIDACNTTCRNFPASSLGTSINTFRYSSNDHFGDGTRPLSEEFKACVPCSYGESICRLFKPPRFFRFDACTRPPSRFSYNGGELTTADVCSPCRLTISLHDQQQQGQNNANNNEAVLLTPLPENIESSNAYNEWWVQRACNNYYQQGYTIDGVNLWKAVQCRFSCPLNYTSTFDSPSAYERMPCILCSEVDTAVCAQIIHSSEVATPAFLDNANMVFYIFYIFIFI